MAVVTIPARPRSDALGWMRKNLISTPVNVALTVLIGAGMAAVSHDRYGASKATRPRGRRASRGRALLHRGSRRLGMRRGITLELETRRTREPDDDVERRETSRADAEDRAGRSS